jgi:anti-sigma factor RsiW
MTCGDVDTLLDAFLDSELPPPMLVSVARHAAACAVCDETIRSFTTLRDSVADTVRRDAAAVDLSGLWARIDGAIDGDQRRRRWTGRVRGTRVWVAGFAMAAAVTLIVLSVLPTAPTQVAGGKVQRVPPNHAYIDRLAGRDVLLRREPKSGTTLIWVNHVEDF